MRIAKLCLKGNRTQWAAFGLVLVSLATAPHAQGPNLAGFVELSYNRNLSIDPESTNVNAFHSYDFLANTYLLNNAHLALSGMDSGTGLGYAVEMDIGQDGALNSTFDFRLVPPLTPSFFSLQEAYGTYAFGPGKAWGLKAGKYATYEGIEVVEGGANPTVTRGFLFGLAEPVTQTGLEINYTASIWDLHLGAVNGWDVMFDNNWMPTFLGKLGLNLGNPLALTVSTLIGPEQNNNVDNMRMSFDATAVNKSLPMTDLWLQVNYGMEDNVTVGTVTDDATWYGVGVQPLVHINDMFAVGLRYEYFSDPEGARTATGVEDLALQNVTVAPTCWLTKNLMTRAEFRMDFANEDVFVDTDNEPSGSQIEVAADLIASF